MNLYNDIFSYIFTLSIAAVIPGPGMLGLLFKTLLLNYKNALSMLFGLVTGDLIYLSISLFGLHYISQFMDSNIAVLLIGLACLYLFYLSFKLWHTQYFSISLPSHSNQFTAYKYSNSTLYSDYTHGLLLTLSNPKTITFYLALVPSIFGAHLKLNHSSLILILISTVFTLLLIGSLYIFSAQKMKILLDHPKHQKIVMKSISLIIFSVALSILYKQIIV